MSYSTLTTPRLLALTIALGTTVVTHGESPGYSPYADRDFPEQLYWGDTHVHTNLSSDSFTFGNQQITPEMAYRFARGETVTGSSGQPVRLSRPLDFVVLTDHAEFLGVFPLLSTRDPVLLDTALGQRWAALYDAGKQQEAVLEFINALAGNNDLEADDRVKEHVWHQVTAAADRHNQPGTFTAFIGYEWSSMPDSRNLHRNIIFRDDASKANQVLPFSALDSFDPEDLWQYLEGYESTTGGKVLAIPHNGNVSNGRMFHDKTLDGAALSRSYAETRARWEPVVEVTQIKGDGESHPYLSPTDEFADFENWDQQSMGLEPEAKEPWMLRHEYARSALKLGLELEQQLGVNPFKFGMIGSSDAHTSLAAVEENNFFSKFGKDEPHADRVHDKLFADSAGSGAYVASGYAAVWATENTREALFDAMQRKETYATTGPRITVRFFGGWDYAHHDHLRPDYAAIGYARGVPMGGDLSQAPEGAAPSFLVVAARDPMGANLDRVQIIKGWLEEDGKAREQIYEVALSDNRQPDPATGRAPALRSTVDVKTASYTNSIGAAELSSVWTDPDFDPTQRAFYYVRVLEIPTPRWTTYDAAFYGTTLPDNFPAGIQERAYTSPIWYTPGP